MTAPDSVYELVAKFERQKPANETELRRQFVDPFFGALGWDVTDSEQVGHEVSVLVDEAGAQKPKRPDYGFRVDGATRFFVETKPPTVNLKSDSTPAFQLRRYGWSGNKPVSILTDFEEFAVYDCRVKPQRSDPASKARLRYYRYGEYIENWNDIAERFSRQAVIDGALQRWIGGTVTRGVVGVDEAFLREMEGWRENLARDIALHNASLSRRDLNLLVQRAIDRIVFLRIAEDRGIESYGRLRSAVAPGRDAYSEIKRLFHEADDKYNSGLFDFRQDALSLQIHISDEALRGIISQLYYPESPYEFSAIPADILGQVYERFLGKVIQLSSAGGVRIEEKPEVRKAGGVYYTPTTIVDYIVRNTVGALLDGASPEAAAELRVLDPACGSGSFLNGAYQYLLDWHLDAYRQNPQRYRNRVRHTPDGMILTTAEKRRILLNNIYGVDLDQSAVEVTKLSLLLKMLENEKGGTGAQTLMFSAGGRILPDLGGNIKWGNSLIGSDFYQGKQMSLLDDEALYRVKAFDWDSGDGFGEVMGAGGFDAVIGNPPYVRQETLGREFKAYAKGKFETYAGTADLYTYFIECGVKLLKQGGLFGIIVANKWMRARYGKPLRQWLKGQAIREIVDFGDLPVFEQATTYPCILTIAKGGAADTFAAAKVESLDFVDLQDYLKSKRFQVNAQLLGKETWALIDDKAQEHLRSLLTRGIPLDDYVSRRFYRGVVTGFNKAFVITREIRDNLIAQHSSSADIIKPFLAGRDVKRYETNAADKFVIFARRGIKIDDYPAVADYLAQFKDELMPKPKDWIGAWPGRKPGPYEWYEIQDAIDYYEEFEKPKIIYPNICKRPEFTLDLAGQYTNQKCFIIGSADLYLLGILNSRLMMFWFRSTIPKLRGDYFEPGFAFMRSFPVRVIDFENPGDVEMHGNMVALVEELIDLHRQRSEVTGIKRDIVDALIVTADKKIDQLVYRLYGLTDDEIAIIE